MNRNEGPAGRRPTSARRQELVAAAAEMFSTRGYHSVTVDEVCRALGLTGPALYRHFPSKQALLVAVFEEVMERQSGRIRELLEEASDPVVLLREMVRLHVEFAISQRVHLNVWRQEFHHLAEADSFRLRRAQRLYLEEWLHIVREARPDLSDAEARALLHGVIALLQSPADFVSGVTDEPLMNLLLTMALAAIREATPARGGNDIERPLAVTKGHEPSS